MREVPVEFDKAIEEIQASIIRDARKIYSEKVIERWLNPKYFGEMESPHGSATTTGPCGDTMTIFLKMKDNKIIDARFVADGCMTTVVAGSMACELAIGRTIKDAYKISDEVILESLDGLPDESVHCALLASNALKETLADYLSSKNEPWRRLYRKK
ncbi:MAG: iron-sulfur cluster assembly scaffold protein [Deltaproteobacteria bacterium]|nr:iron-sulfur cluster assembly scaffold protein [Deltaproteobacteria bacterium]